jgi:ABC-2 type transport system permease protein
MRRVLAVAKKELRQLQRDPIFLLLQLLFPALALLVFGSLFSVTLHKLPVSVLDLDDSLASRQLLRQLDATDYFSISPRQKPSDALEDGSSLAALEIAPRFARGREAGLQVLVDGSDGAARAADGYLERFLREVPPHPPRETARISTVTWFNAERRDADFFVPGVVALILFAAPVIFTGLSLVREKEQGTWESLCAVPVGDLELLAGKLFPYVLHALLLSLVLLSVAHSVFQVPMRGSLPLLVEGTALFALIGVGFGGVLSSLSPDENTVWRRIQIFVLLPGFVLSGFIYPISSMPEAAQLASRLFPIRAYLELLRGVMLKGADAEALSGQLHMLEAFAVGMLATSVFLLGRSRRPAP